MLVLLSLATKDDEVRAGPILLAPGSLGLLRPAAPATEHGIVGAY
jgi:hypothetical protein